MSCSLVLFTRDLRVRDQAALAEAVRTSERTIPLFVLDDALLAGVCGSPNRVAHLHDCLTALDAGLRERGGRLAIRRGDPVREALRVAREGGAEAIHISDDYSAHARRRFAALEKACEGERISLHTHPGVTIVEPGAVEPSGGGDHYRVFTPYWRAWREVPRRAVLASPRQVELPSAVRPGRVPSGRRLAEGLPRAAPPKASPDLLAGGEQEARRRLERWLRSGLGSYPDRHDDLAGAATSRLSADLHFGALSPNAVLDRVEGREGAEDFVRQLCWRDFHHQVLAARPDLPRADYRRRGKRWRRSRAVADAWREGRTGVPIVDAGMRQLDREGFMHNRARMVVASYLTKTLRLDWRIGARHFERLLIDADVANNSGNWQWVAGTGNDTRPNRVLNPERQEKRFDADGEYVRRYL